MTQRSFPARWLALLLMGSVGAAWALNPSDAEKSSLGAGLVPASKTVVEGDAQAVCQLMGSVIGELALSPEDRTLLASPGLSRRVVLESVATPGSVLQNQRDRAEFLRTVEELEAEYVASGQYPALPASSGQADTLSYRTDGEDYTLSSGNRRYTAEQGMAYGTPPASGAAFQVRGFLSPKSSGWGPWRREGVQLDLKPGSERSDDLAFLQDLPQGERGSARLFFPVDRTTCGYLFHRHGGQTVYSSGELAYDAVSGNFSLKLFRHGQAETHSLSPASLEAELAKHDTATTLVGEAALLADMGLMGTPAKDEEVVAVSTAAALPCSVSSALDGLRLATLERHKEVLPAGKFAAAEDAAPEASLVGSREIVDKLGQLHHLRVRGGRGANYDWVVGQVCPLAKEARSAGFVDSEAASYLQEDASRQHPIKAGQ
jgi:hypothetical protein